MNQAWKKDIEWLKSRGIVFLGGKARVKWVTVEDVLRIWSLHRPKILLPLQREAAAVKIAENILALIASKGQWSEALKERILQSICLSFGRMSTAPWVKPEDRKIVRKMWSFSCKAAADDHFGVRVGVLGARDPVEAMASRLLNIWLRGERGESASKADVFSANGLILGPFEHWRLPGVNEVKLDRWRKQITNSYVGGQAGQLRQQVVAGRISEKIISEMQKVMPCGYLAEMIAQALGTLLSVPENPPHVCLSRVERAVEELIEGIIPVNVEHNPILVCCKARNRT